MTARRVAVLAALVSMGASGYYVYLYLIRWEWNRAVVAGVIFLAAEIALVGLLLLDRLVRIQKSQAQTEPDPRLLGRLNGAPSTGRQPFAWLRPSDQLSVFVPVLLGAGVVLSGAAWIVERLARFTAGPALEKNLARRLQGLAPPRGGVLGEDGQPHDPFSPSP